MRRLLEHSGPLLCAAGALCLFAAVAIDLDSTGAKVLMAASAACFVPGAFLTLAWVRFRVGPPR